MNVEKIRSDFPILGREVNGKPLIYLDSGATAQKPRRVIECVERIYSMQNANIHRGVHRLSEEATELYEQARERVREFIGAAEREQVIFTAGATASILFSPVDPIVIKKGHKVVCTDLCFQRHFSRLTYFVHVPDTTVKEQ